QPGQLEGDDAVEESALGVLEHLRVLRPESTAEGRDVVVPVDTDDMPAPLFDQVLGLFDLPLDALLQAKVVLANPYVYSDSGYALGCYLILAVGERQL